MTRLFEEREYAAENLFAHDEELRFLAQRRAMHSLGAWAAECMAMSPEAALDYEGRLVDAFIAGTLESAIVAQVQTDLEHAGKPALSTTAGTVLAQATAAAIEGLRGHKASAPPTEAHAVRAHRAAAAHDFWGWRDPFH